MSPLTAMDERATARLLGEARERHRARNPRSEEAVRRLAHTLPGGDTRTTTWFEPFPLIFARAEGALLHDLDGHELIDLIGNYTALVHGHSREEVVAAATVAIERGNVTGAPLQEQGDLSDQLIERVRSVERVRFTNSGTEANLIALRIASAHTGRRGVAVARHSYHGSFERLDWEQADAMGTTVFPAGDQEGTRLALDAAPDLAAIFIEPVLGSGGVITVSGEYLTFLREQASARGALLVFDEVMTLRLGYGGRQEAVGVRPDLTTLGKLIGGGLPIGAVGGSEEIMSLTDPRKGPRLGHSGTFNGNRAAMAAGAAALARLDHDAIDRLNAAGEKLQDGIRREIEFRNLPLSVTGCGSMLNLHARPGVATPDDAQAAAESPLKSLLHLLLLEEGVFMAQRGELCTNTALTDTHLEAALAAIRRAFDRIAVLDELQPTDHLT